MIALSVNSEPIKYPNNPPKEENMVAIINIFKYSFFFAITIGTIKISGGIGKNELSIKDIKAKKNFELLCAASFKDFWNNFLNIAWF